jgi:hypothetical protein
MSTIMGVSWVAVIVGAVLAFILGWIWYSQFLFGKRWAESLGVELGSASSMPMGAMVTQAVALLGLAWVAALVAGNVWLWGLVILAFAILNFSGGMFGQRGSTANWVDAGHLVANGVLLWIVNLWL